MRKAEVETFFRELNRAEVRYLVAGGVAVVAYGYARFTNDIDIVLAMERENLLKAIEVLENLGYRPRVPVTLKNLADDTKRRQWIEQKRALVLNLDGKHPDGATVAFFFQFPFDFDLEWRKAEWSLLRRGMSMTFDPKLEWLEQASDFADHLQRTGDTDSSPSDFHKTKHST